MTVTIRGLQEAQRAMLRTIAAVRPDGGLGQAVQFFATGLQRYLVTVTHVDTGTYRASQYVRALSPAKYEIYIADGKNPRTGQLASKYGPIEEARGGDHAAYRRTVEVGAPQLAERAAAYIARMVA